MDTYIWQNSNWPHFTWNGDHVRASSVFAERKQSELEGAMAALGFSIHQESTVSAITKEIEKSAQIEGEFIDAKDIRSPVARHLGAENILTQDAIHRLASNQISDRRNYIVEIVLDAIKKMQ